MDFQKSISSMKNIFLSILFLSIFCQLAFAQQDNQSMQYMYTVQKYNPAYTGTVTNVEVSSTYTKQWLGIEGSPQTFSLLFNAPLRKGLGLGISANQDQLGAMQETQISADIAYRFKLTRMLTMSFGIKGGFDMLDINMNKLNIFHENEPSTLNLLRTLSPTIGAGTFLYTTKRTRRKQRNFYLGLSSPNFYIPNRKDDVQSTYQDKIQANLLMGCVFENNRNKIKIKPAGMIRYVNGAPLSWNLSTNVMFNDIFIVGLGYQWKSGITLFLGTHVQKRFFVGYTFDFNTTALRSFNYGSHELLIRFKFGKLNFGKIQSSRFF